MKHEKTYRPLIIFDFSIECSCDEHGPVKRNENGESTTPLYIDENIVYPNPTTKNITIGLETIYSNKENYFYLYDEIGQLIEKYLITNNLTTISLNNIAAGIYYYRIVDDKQNLIKSDKLLIIN